VFLLAEGRVAKLDRVGHGVSDLGLERFQLHKRVAEQIGARAERLHGNLVPFRFLLTVVGVLGLWRRAELLLEAAARRREVVRVDLRVELHGGDWAVASWGFDRLLWGLLDLWGNLLDNFIDFAYFLLLD